MRHWPNPKNRSKKAASEDYALAHVVLSCGRDSPHQLRGPGDLDRAGTDRIPSLAAALDGRRGQTRTVWKRRRTFRRIGWTGWTGRAWELLSCPLNLGSVNRHIAEESPGVQARHFPRPKSGHLCAQNPQGHGGPICPAQALISSNVSAQTFW